MAKRTKPSSLIYLGLLYPAIQPWINRNSILASLSDAALDLAALVLPSFWRAADLEDRIPGADSRGIYTAPGQV